MAASAAGAWAGPAGSGLPPELELSDEALLAGQLDPSLTARLLDSSFVGIALRAPTRVSTDRYSVLPVLVISRFNGARDWSTPLRAHGWLVALEQGSGQVVMAPAFASAKQTVPAGLPPRPSAEELLQFGAQITPIDVRERLAMPWGAACWSIRLIYYDWVSNPVQIQLEDELQRRGAACLSTHSSPAQVAFQLQAAKGGTLRVKGEFTLPPYAVRDNPAVLAATLLIVNRETTTPERIDWPIPLESTAAGGRVAGRFDHAWSDVSASRAGAVAYLAIGGQLYGPQPLGAAPRPPGQ